LETVEVVVTLGTLAVTTVEANEVVAELSKRWLEPALQS
jgi:hypothetical protein